MNEQVLIGEKSFIQCISLSVDPARKGETGTIENENSEYQNSKKYFNRAGSEMALLVYYPHL
jgi:hypothetical protein